MPSGVTIRFESVSKRFGAVQAVDDLSFTVQPGRVTGFLGPNGAGKTTSLRMLLGLVRPTSGTATFDGVPYRDLPSPLETVGAALEAASFHPGRSARDHLRVYAHASGIPVARVERVLEQVGLSEYAHRRVGGYSLGMRQRLGLANALLGDPRVLVLDEPVNGLDPEGIRWIRGFLREMAGEGRTVLVSSHLLSEVQQSVDDVVILTRGRLVHLGTLQSLGADTTVRTTVDAPDRDALRAVLVETGYAFEEGQGGFVVDDADAVAVGRIAHLAHVQLSELHAQQIGLEDRFLALVEAEEAR
jgi:ABC-2 type transport system ATP-binding protein